MLKLAVVGKDVSQSESPNMHTFLLNAMGETCSYERVSIPPERFLSEAESLFRRYDGFNVTIPYKAEIIPFLTSLEGDAKKFGAVNTVCARERTGYNTDGFGFLLMLENAGVPVKGKTALVFGTGGAGRTAIIKLQEAGATVFAYDCDEERVTAFHREFPAFTPLKEVPLRPFDLLLNCTGIGMHDTVGQTPSVAWQGGGVAPVGKELISLADWVIDLIYVPEESEFLRLARKSKKKARNGLSMLFYQAYFADCVYLRRTPNAREASVLYLRYLEEAR